MVDPNRGNLGARVFFLWGSLCLCSYFYTFFLIPETKGLTLEQVDKMMEETTPRTSAKWQPHSTFAEEMGLTANAEKSADVPPQVTEVSADTPAQVAEAPANKEVEV